MRNPRMSEEICVYCNKEIGLRPDLDCPVAHQSCQYIRDCRETSKQCIFCGKALGKGPLRARGLAHRACKEYVGFG